MSDLDNIDINVMPGAPSFKERKKTGGKTSVEAAVEYLDAMEAQKTLFDMDALERAALRRAMGFDFKVDFAPSKIFVSAIGHKKLRTHAKISAKDFDKDGNLINKRVNARLVDACLRLKEKYDAKVQPA
jgi:hypothetical protein